MIEFDFTRLVSPYMDVYSYDGEEGYVVWRLGTGLNAELLHIRAGRPGGGSELLKVMLQRLKARPPYATVFGFTRVSNVEALRFYAEAGFTVTRVAGVYDEGEAAVFSARYEDLCRRFGV